MRSMSLAGNRVALGLGVTMILAACGASPAVERQIEARNAALSRGSGGAQALPGAAAGTDVAPGAADGSLATNLSPSAAAAGSAGGARTGSSPAQGRTVISGPAGAAVAGPALGPAVSGGAGRALPPAGGNGGATDVGVTAQSIKVGGTFFNGNYLDKYSQVTEQSARAYFRYINDQGGIYGRKIDYLSCDSAGTADGTQGCVRKLVNDDKVFALGSSLDFNIDTVMPFVSQQRVPWVGSSGLYPKEFETPGVFPTQIRGVDVGALIGTFSKQQLGVATVGVSYLNDVAGPECTERVEDIGNRLGFRVVAKVSNQQIEGDLTGKVVEMRSKNPDAVLFCNDPINTIKFIQAAGRTGYKPPKGWVGGFVAADDVPQAVGAAGVGMYGFTAYDFYRSDTPGIRRYRQITEHYYPSTFHHFYEQASYIGAVALVEAITRAGPQLTRARLLDAMRSLTDFDTGMGLRLNFANLRAGKPSGIMLQADANLRWQVSGGRFAAP
jgi:branched-chain amino acid transport system substrate-binding protein